MILESANFLLKASVNSEVDVKGEYVRDSCEEFDVAKFERSAFSLIENESDFGVMKREIDFHFRA